MNTHNLMHSMNLQHVFCAGHRYKSPDQLASQAHQRLHFSHNHLIKLLAGLRTELILFSPLFIHHDFMHTHKFRTGNHTRNNISATEKIHLNHTEKICVNEDDRMWFAHQS